MRPPLNSNAARLRLFHLREQGEAVAATMCDERERFAALRKDAAKPRAVSAFNLFQTPEPIADRMVSMLPELGEGSRVLEPSAGLGRIYRALRKRSACPVVLVEQSEACAAELYRETQGDGSASLLVRDFLSYDPGPVFDSVVMNPPFKMGRDVKHIQHARTMLKPGGVLVSLCYDGTRQRRHLEPVASSWEPLPPDSFKSEGTRAGVVLLTMRA